MLLASGIDLVALLRAARPAQLAALLGIGLLGTVGHLLLILAFGLARTSTLMPLLHARIVIGALLGWIVFAQLPDTVAWLGMALLGTRGAASAWVNVRESNAARPASRVALDTVGE